nr:RNA-directed DNA polymerase, eukaryota [Tanacetum cinerariifolium]
MQNIMVMVLEESDEISVELLKPLLASVKRHNAGVLPVARMLGETVLWKSAEKIRPYLRQAVTVLGDPFDAYTEIVATVCGWTTATRISYRETICSRVKPQIYASQRLNLYMQPFYYMIVLVRKRRRNTVISEDLTEPKTVQKDQNILFMSGSLWKLCQSYGTVVDVYIPNRRSKAGKRFAFVRFIKVENVDRLVVAPSYVSAAKGIISPPLTASPAMVLEDSCLINHDLENYVMGEVKLLSSINNLRVLLSNEGFANVRIVYLGGQWVMIELSSAKSKSKFLKHVGVASWFKSLSNSQTDFITRDRTVWVDVERVPMHAWSRNTFHNIGSNWGEVLDLEENRDNFFARKRICIKTNQEDNILEKFKIIVKGKIFVIRAKELFVWSPSFTEVAENDFNSDDESDKESSEIYSTIPGQQVNTGEESDNEAISETVFGENAVDSGNATDPVPKEALYDPFKTYDLLHKNTKAVETDGTSSSIPFPPGFTPEKNIPETKSDSIFDMVIKNIWGSSNFDVSVSEAVDNPGGLVEIQLEGYNYTWAHPSASKMSKLDRFLASDGLLLVFPHISAVCLDRHLSDHRPILLREVIIDYSAIPFRLFHSWFEFQGFDTMVIQTWNSIILNDNNGMIRFKKKLQFLKRAIRAWIANRKKSQMNTAQNIRSKLRDIDIKLDQGDVNEDLLLSPVKGVMIDGDWIDDPKRVKDEFRDHFASRFNEPGPHLSHISFPFPNRLNDDQSADLETPITRDEIRLAVWGSGENKSPGPDGFTFEFFRKFWFVIGPDFCTAVEWFFEHASFPIGCNSSFIALIPKTLEPKSGDSLAPYLFILVMESSHLSFSCVIEAGLFTGIQIDSSVTLSHLFYADDAIFIGEWNRENLKCITHMLHCFSLLSGLSINLKKSQLLGVGMSDNIVTEAAISIGC